MSSRLIRLPMEHVLDDHLFVGPLADSFMRRCLQICFQARSACVKVARSDVGRRHQDSSAADRQLWVGPLPDSYSKCNRRPTAKNRLEVAHLGWEADATAPVQSGHVGIPHRPQARVGVTEQCNYRLAHSSTG